MSRRTIRTGLQFWQLRVNGGVSGHKFRMHSMFVPESSGMTLPGESFPKQITSIRQWMTIGGTFSAVQNSITVRCLFCTAIVSLHYTIFYGCNSGISGGKTMTLHIKLRQSLIEWAQYSSHRYVGLFLKNGDITFQHTLELSLYTGFGKLSVWLQQLTKRCHLVLVFWEWGHMQHEGGWVTTWRAERDRFRK